MSTPPKFDAASRVRGLSIIEIKRLDASTARAVVEREHYLHRKPSVVAAFGLWEGENLEGVVTFGIPASRHLMMSVCPSDPALIVELNRLWVSDSMPRNTESMFVAKALKEMPPRIVVSFADTTMGHMGYVYRAMNFHYAGWTDMERKSARWDYIPDAGGHSRGAFRGGGWSGERVQRKPKIRYWTVTGNKAERRHLTKLCAWPSLSWKEEPPPIEHQKRSNRIQETVDHFPYGL